MVSNIDLRPTVMITTALALICFVTASQAVYSTTRSPSTPRQCRDLTAADAPINGALVCHEYLGRKYCAVRCNSGYQTALTPRFYEFCSPETNYRWTFEDDESTSRINSCIQSPGGDAMFSLSGACNDLSVAQKDAVVQVFYARILSRMPGVTISPSYSGELICHGGASPMRTCRNLTVEEAPKNGALVCYNGPDAKICEPNCAQMESVKSVNPENCTECNYKRCNSGYDRFNYIEQLTCSNSSNYNWTNLLEITSIPFCIEEWYPIIAVERPYYLLPNICNQMEEHDQNEVKEDLRRTLARSGRENISLDDITILCGEVNK